MVSLLEKKFWLRGVKCLRLGDGFTLIELLVVISVIAILMGILMPVLGIAKRSAQRAACREKLHQLGIGVKMYLDDYSNTYPPAVEYLWHNPDPNRAIMVFLKPYIKSPQAYLCPGDQSRKTFLFQSGSTGGSSYEYNASLDNRVLGKKERNVHVLSDYDCFHHKDPNSPAAKNYLYADGHIGDYRMQ
jgi:prepilin-type N-terminal cleavage/methylation domain-containing protein/prepilin-type processing-associated H-X9-DG protein